MDTKREIEALVKEINSNNDEISKKMKQRETSFKEISQYLYKMNMDS
jgi:methyl-accepting chemotaxis protein